MAALAESEDQSEEGSYGSGDESYTEEDSEEDDDEEALLRYRRFAKDVVNNLSKGGPGENKNVIQSMAVHPKVRALCKTVCLTTQ